LSLAARKKPQIGQQLYQTRIYSDNTEKLTWKESNKRNNSKKV